MSEKKFTLTLTRYRWAWLADLVCAIKRHRGKHVWRMRI